MKITFNINKIGNNKKIMAVSLAGVLLFAVGMIFVSENKIFVTAAKAPFPQNRAIHSGGPLTPDEFIKQGGRSMITIVPATTTIDVTRGTTTTNILTLKLVPIANPLSNVTITAMGIGTGYIPPLEAKMMTPTERVNELQKTGKIPGAIDLNSIVSFSPKTISLENGKSGEITMTIKVPKDWPNDTVGQKILLSAIYSASGTNSHDLLIYPTPIWIHVVS